MQTNIPIDIGYFRKDLNTTLTPVSITQGHGTSVLIGMAEGYVFVYDPETDGLSELDERTQFTALQAVATYADKRVAVWRDSGATTIRASSWGLDDSTNDTTAQAYYFVTPVWDFDLPMEASKLLIDCHVVTSELVPGAAGSSCQVEYQVEENGTWVDIGTKHTDTHHVYTGSSESTYTTTDGGMTNTTTNNSVIFTQIRFRVTIKGGPKVYRFTARAFDTGYVETWNFTIAVDDDNFGTSHTVRAYQKRDWLWEQKQAHAIIPFLDGMRYPELSPDASGNPRAYSSHSVVLEDIEDIYTNVEQKAAGEGIMRITLRTLTGN